MKQDIHPTYHAEATVRCACGNTFTIGSTEKEIETEICSNCHPFYTGKGKLIDSAGRIEKFEQRMQKHEKLQKEKEKVQKRRKKNKKEQDEPEKTDLPEQPDLPEQAEDSNIRVVKGS